MANECPSSVDHVDGHGEALKRYMRHPPMQHVQGYTGSHWMSPSGDYSLRIALAAARARATANKTTMYHVPTLMAIRWSSQCGGTIPRTSPDGGGPGLSYKPLNTAIGWALAPIGQSVIAMLLFGLSLRCDGDFVERWQLLHRGVTYQSDGKDLADWVEYLYRGAKLVS